MWLPPLSFTGRAKPLPLSMPLVDRLFQRLLAQYLFGHFLGYGTVLGGTGGAVQLAVVGAGGVGARLRSAEALATDPEAAGQAAAGEVAPSDDPLASGWYRARTLPALVAQVLNDLEESA